ncbi:uncharacterized protein LOC121394982 [Xenopus laevis]|uniref:Uncharacterized protein LOC121393104 n=1 Tax=Xenopus laevis TaxID=8355 RepID=A0A8J1KLC9_XENLA|nr:uncharacterized protein LOC121393104 [Xenopus laevis]XP_041423191.1 uncharacterized protein LOC121394982 [Xenopus laevis]
MEEAICAPEIEQSNGEEYITLETVELADIMNFAGNDIETTDEETAGPSAPCVPESPPAIPIPPQRSAPGPFSARRRTPGRGRPVETSDHLNVITHLGRSYMLLKKKKARQMSRHMSQMQNLQLQTVEKLDKLTDKLDKLTDVWQETNIVLREMLQAVLMQGRPTTISAVQNEEPALAVQTEEPALAVQTEEPALAVQTEEPALAVQTEEPATAVQTEEPARATVTNRVGLRRGGRRVRPTRFTDL